MEGMEICYTFVLSNLKLPKMKKQIKYPSQDDVQILIDIMNRQNIYDGAAKGEFKN